MPDALPLLVPQFRTAHRIRFSPESADATLPPMPINLTVFLLSGKEPEAGPVVLAALREAFPNANIRVVETVQAALLTPVATGTELLILTNPGPTDAAQAVEAMDASNLPRWAVVILGTSDRSEQITVPPEDWNPRSMARALHSALTQHTLRRENARARGDLKTISRRLTHDLRAQVGGILTTAEALRETLAGGAGASQLQPVIDATDGMIKLIDRMNFVIRASADPKPKEPFDMGMACWASLQRLETQILNRHAVVTQPASWPEAKGVAPWLEVVWWNLLTNALQHGGKLPCIEIGWNQDGDEVRFWLQDNGPGVPDERRAQLFHPFHLLHEPNAPNGLGLPIVRRLVELQGGKCGYERVHGKSRFFFTLPSE
jgi:signal transduction histidine kinase